MTNTRPLRAEPQESAPAAPSKSRRFPQWAVALALVLALAVGVGIGWLASGRDSASSSAADPEIEEFVDDLFAAWNAYDADAIRAMATGDAVLSNTDVTATGALSLETAVEDYRVDGVSFERVGDPIVRDGGAVIDVVQLFRGGGAEGTEQQTILVLRLVREDGTLKVEWTRPYNYTESRSLGV